MVDVNKQTSGTRMSRTHTRAVNPATHIANLLISLTMSCMDCLHAHCVSLHVVGTQVPTPTRSRGVRVPPPTPTPARGRAPPRALTYETTHPTTSFSASKNFAQNFHDRTLGLLAFRSVLACVLASTGARTWRYRIRSAGRL